MWHCRINEILGIWLALAPLFRLDRAAAGLSNLFIGVLVAVVSSDMPITNHPWESWVGVAAGTWVAFTSCFQFFVTGGGYLWSNVAAGALIVVASLCVPTYEPAGTRIR
ncbi:MAG TPA: hypothetical protein VL126_16825 [Bacteroidota bacterium]|nr:hypothetical protein [Bacteroidota bacterium]